MSFKTTTYENDFIILRFTVSTRIVIIHQLYLAVDIKLREKIDLYF